MASEIILTLWSDLPASVSLAADLAAEAAKQVFRSTGQQTCVVSSSSREVTALLEDGVTVAATAQAEADEAAAVAAEQEAVAAQEVAAAAEVTKAEEAQIVVAQELYAAAPADVQAAVQAAPDMPAVNAVLSDFYTPLAGLTPAPEATA